jgi:hypothetical protein
VVMNFKNGLVQFPCIILIDGKYLGRK